MLKLKEKAIALIFAAAIALTGSAAFAQTKVSGVVSDTFGEPLPGASVVENGTQNGVITDLDGAYTITVKDGATLSFSFIGFLHSCPLKIS